MGSSTFSGGSQHRQQMEPLEDKAEPRQAEPGELPVAQLVEPGAGELHASGGRRVDPAEQLEQGGFAAARGPDDGHVLALAHRQRDAAERVHRLAVHRVVLGEFACPKQNRALGRVYRHVASVRSVAAIGARAARSAG